MSKWVQYLAHITTKCANRSCGLTQFYGYTTAGRDSEIHFNDDWQSLPYFLSSRESVFSMQLLRQFHSEVVIGQMSFKQCADAYNYRHTYMHSINKEGEYSLWVGVFYVLTHWFETVLIAVLLVCKPHSTLNLQVLKWLVTILQKKPTNYVLPKIKLQLCRLGMYMCSFILLIWKWT